MKTRLIVAIITTLLQETLLVILFLWGLPQLGITLPLWVLILAMFIWVGLAITLYRIGSRALRRKQVGGLTAMIGSRGIVIRSLSPEGLIKIRNELWEASTTDENIKRGEVVHVVGQNRLKLIVKKVTPSADQGHPV